MEKGYRVRHKEKDTGFKWESQASEMEKVEVKEKEREHRGLKKLLHHSK